MALRCTLIRLGKRVKQIRELQNMSLDELAKKTNIKKSYLIRIEQGTAIGIKLNHIEKLVKSFNVTLEDIL